KPPVPSGFLDKDYLDISNDAKRRIGILSTPVIDAKIDPAGANPTTGTMYFTLYTSDVKDFNHGPIDSHGTQFHALLYAVDITTGVKVQLPGNRSNPIEIGGRVKGRGYQGKPGAQTNTLADGSIVVSGSPKGTLGGRKIQLRDHETPIVDGLKQSGV